MAKIAIGNSVSVSSNLAWMLNNELWQHAHAFTETDELGNHEESITDNNITDAAQPDCENYVGAHAAGADDWTSIFANGPFAAGVQVYSDLPYSSAVMGECY
jgi:hypothetical protein